MHTGIKLTERQDYTLLFVCWKKTITIKVINQENCRTDDIACDGIRL